MSITNEIYERVRLFMQQNKDYPNVLILGREQRVTLESECFMGLGFGYRVATKFQGMEIIRSIEESFLMVGKCV